jgi:hypothetical protein
MTKEFGDSFVMSIKKPLYSLLKLPLTEQEGPGSRDSEVMEGIMFKLRKVSASDPKPLSVVETCGDTGKLVVGHNFHKEVVNA